MFAVYYKIKSAKDDYSTITFDSPSISVVELKEKILEQKYNIKKMEDFDLEIVNSQTGDDYSDTTKYNDHSQIPKNTSLIVSRVPITRGRFGKSNFNSKTGSSMNDSYKRRFPGPDYICHRCNNKGHFIHDCPTNSNPEYDIHKVKKATGIPKTFLQPVTVGDTSQTLRMANGSLAVMKPNEHVFEKSYKVLKVRDDDLDIPNDYKCPLCKGILREPLMIPCCGYSFCSECISPDTPTDTLLCPTCKKVTHPNKFINNKSLSLEIEKWILEKENGSDSDKNASPENPSDEIPKKKQEKTPETNGINKEEEEAFQKRKIDEEKEQELLKRIREEEELKSREEESKRDQNDRRDDGYNDRRDYERRDYDRRDYDRRDYGREYDKYYDKDYYEKDYYDKYYDKRDQYYRPRDEDRYNKRREEYYRRDYYDAPYSRNRKDYYQQPRGKNYRY